MPEVSELRQLQLIPGGLGAHMHMQTLGICAMHGGSDRHCTRSGKGEACLMLRGGRRVAAALSWVLAEGELCT